MSRLHCLQFWKSESLGESVTSGQECDIGQPSTLIDLHSVEPLGPAGLTPSRLLKAVSDDSIRGVDTKGLTDRCNCCYSHLVMGIV